MNVENLNLYTTPGNSYPDYYSNLACHSIDGILLTKNNNFPYWLSTINSMVDLRVTLVKCCADNTANYCALFDTWPSAPNYLTDTSSASGVMTAFTTEALFYAQSAYFTSVVMVQWSNVFTCKSRKVYFM